MSQHEHAHLMKLYAEDAAETDAPWNRWERQSSSGCPWYACEEEDMVWSRCKYRRKPKEYQMTEADWARVIGGGFYVSYEDEPAVFKASVLDDITKAASTLRVVREKGLRQPHFVGDKHPEGMEDLWVYFTNTSQGSATANNVNWDAVSAYIVL